MKAKFCLFLFVGFLAVCLTGCSCAQKTAKVEPVPVTKLEPVAAPPAVQPMPPPKPVAQQPMPQSVFFPTDKAEITPQTAVVLKNQAEFLKDNPGTKIEITGNADQRGSEAYNQTLAQKRADAVKGYLVEMGVNPDRLTTRSLGKDKPVCDESTGNCYAANRRADLQAIG